MSSEEHEAHAGAHDEHHEEFDPSPVQTLGAGEPETPLWLSAVGVALFGLAGLYMALGGAEEEPAPAPTPVVSTPPTPEAPPVAAERAPARGAATPRGRPRPPQTAAERKALADRLRALRGRQQLKGQRPAPRDDGAKR